MATKPPALQLQAARQPPSMQHSSLPKAVGVAGTSLHATAATSPSAHAHASTAGHSMSASQPAPVDTHKPHTEVDMDQILLTFTDRHTSTLFSRQVASLNKLCRVKAAGLRVLDVLVTVDLLSICRQRISSGRTEFIEPTAKLIRLHAMPFVQDNSFQTLQHSDLMARMLREVAAFFFDDKPNLYLQLASAELLRTFASRGRREGPAQAPGDVTLPARKGLVAMTEQPLGYRLSLLADVPAIAVRALQQLSSQAARQHSDNEFGGSGNMGGGSGTSSPNASVTGSFATMKPRVNPNFDTVEPVPNVAAAPEEPPAFAVLEQLVTLVRDLALAAEGACALVRSNLCSCLAALLRHPLNSTLIPLTLELMWLLAEYDPTAVPTFANATVLRALHELLLELLQTGFRGKDKEIRNEIVTLLVIIARVPSARIWFIRMGTLEHLLLVSTCSELKQHELELIKPFTQTNSAEDLELKLAAWEIIRLLLPDHRCLSRVIPFQLLEALLSHLQAPIPGAPGHIESTKLLAAATAGTMTLNATGQNGGKPKWNRAHQIQIQTKALELLCELADLLPNQLYSHGAVHTLWKFAVGNKRWPSPSGDDTLGNAHSGQLLADPNASLAQMATQALSTLLKRLDAKPTDVNLMQALVELVVDSARTPVCRAEAASCIATLCRHHPVNQRLFRKAGNGIDRLMPLLRSPPPPPVAGKMSTTQMFSQTGSSTLSSSTRVLSTAGKLAVGVNATHDTGTHLDPTVMLAVLDALWSAVVRSTSSEAVFKLHDGVELLLDLLVQGPVLLRKPLLGLLSDLLMNHKLAIAADEWRSPASINSAANTGGRSAVQLLLDMWQEQQSIRELDSAIADPSRPLGSDAGDERVQRMVGLGLSTPRMSALTPRSAAPLSAIPEGGAGVGVGGQNVEPVAAGQAWTKADPQTQGLSPVVVQAAVGADLRPAIFALLQRFRLEDLPELVPTQRANLQTIMQYPDFCQGHAWRRIADELVAEGEQVGFRPTTPDAELVRERLETSEARAAATQSAQLAQLNQQGEEMEQRFISNLMSTIKNGGLAAPAAAAGAAPKKRRSGMKAAGNRLAAAEQQSDMISKALDKEATLASIMNRMKPITAPPLSPKPSSRPSSRPPSSSRTNAARLYSAAKRRPMSGQAGSRPVSHSGRPQSGHMQSDMTREDLEAEQYLDDVMHEPSMGIGAAAHHSVRA